MRLRLFVLIVLAALLSVAKSSAQTSSVPTPAATLSPESGDVNTVHRLQARNLMPNADVTVVVFDPSGGQTVLHGHSDTTGALDMSLQPAGSPWQLGVYRAVVALPHGQAVSATFLANDGGVHVAVRPDLPSPNSALIISGVGLPASSRIRLVLTLAGGLGQRDVSASTDASGGLSSFVWPQALGFDFLSAGRYELQAPELGLDTAFYVREHPSTSFINVPGTVVSGTDEQIGLADYAVGRYLWAAFTRLDAHAGGEFLIGPTDVRGSVQATVRFPDLPPGEYTLGTPYDWGETTFTVPAPTATPTATSTATPTSTATALPTATSTPHSVATVHKKCKAIKGHKKRCKR